MAALLLGMCSYLNAQSLTGQITSNNQNLSEVQIQVLNTSLKTTSKADGSYFLAIPQGTYEVSYSLIGYATKIKTIKITTSTILDIELLSNSSSLSEVVVTAQKKEQNVQKIPIAITSLNDQRITETRTWSLEDLTSLIPNYSYSKLGVGFQELQSIRGIQVFSENPAIAIYVDGVNSLDIAAGGIQLMDIERVEVLRGPQGTLYGRNALGGVVNIVTKKPTNDTKGFYESSLGNLGLQRHGVSFKIALQPNKLFFGAAAQYQYRNGFLTNNTEGTADPQPGQNNRRVGDESSIYGNVFLKWLASSKWDVLLNVKTQLDQSDASAFFVSVADDQLAINNPDQINLGRVGSHKRHLLNTSAAINYKGESTIFSSVSAYQRVGLQFDNIDYFPAFAGQIFTSYRDGQRGVMNKPQEVFSQEFKIQSKPDNDKMDYTAGLYYFNQTNYEPSTNTSRILNATQLDVFTQVGKNEGVAIFGQLEYAFAKAFTLTAGLRYEYEQRELTFGRFIDEGGTITYNTPLTQQRGNYEALLPKFAVAYEINNQQNLYASYTRGFRAGGINGDLLPQGVSQTFDPEFSDNYELGYKSNWFNNRLSINLSLFHIDWQNLQFFNSFGNFVFARDNVGDARSTGIEIEVISKPIKNLQVEASLGLNDTEYKEFILSRDVFDMTTNTINTVTTDLTGNQLSNAPSYTLFLAGQYQIPFKNKSTLSIRGEMRSAGEQFTDIQNDLTIDPYQLFNAMLTYQKGSYSLSAWVRNIGNERYISFGSADTSFGRSTLMAEPRTYGATLNIKF